MSAQVAVCASFDAEDIARIQDQAAARGLSPQEWVRRIVERELETADVAVMDSGMPLSRAVVAQERCE